jgi:hypothetical protein
MSSLSFDQRVAYEPFVAELDGAISPFRDRRGYRIDRSRGRFPGRTLRRDGEVELVISIDLGQEPDGSYPPTFDPAVLFRSFHSAGVTIGRDLHIWYPAGGFEARTVPFYELRNNLPGWLERSADYFVSVGRDEVVLDGWRVNLDVGMTLQDAETFAAWLVARQRADRRPPAGKDYEKLVTLRDQGILTEQAFRAALGRLVASTK